MAERSSARFDATVRSRNDVPVRSKTHPLKRLFEYARAYRRDVIFASVFSVLNKFFDVLPEVLIGVAVDVVVNRKASFLARFGVVEPHRQLLVLGALTVVIWVLESLFEYLYVVRWRNLAQNSSSICKPLRSVALLTRVNRWR